MIQNKQDIINSWKEHNQCFYQYLYQNNLDYPCTSCQWGPVISDSEQFKRQKLYFSCRTGGVYNETQNSWKSTPNYIVVATVELPNQGYYFINDLKSLFNYEQAKKHPNLKIKQVIMHPGQINVIRASPSNRKILATKNDNNYVYIWYPQKHKSTSNSHPNIPDIMLLTTNSTIPNFSLVFTPTLPRVASSSGNKIQVFDLEGGGTTARRQLGSVLSSSVIAPYLTLDVQSNNNATKQKIEDISFKDKNNDLCISGGHGRRIGIWDVRVGTNTAYIDGLHQSDINCLSWKGNYMISGGSDKKVNIIDQRKTKTALYSFQNKKQVLSIHWNSQSNHFGVGSENLSIYNFQDIQKENRYKPIFTHFGMRGSINDFDWNSENPWDIVSTCLQQQPQVPALGGYLHVYRPLDLLYLDKEKAASKLQKAFEKLSKQKLKIYQ